MIVDIDVIRDRLKTNRIAAVQDQQLGMAKHIVHQQIQRPASEMIAYYMPDGNVVVTPKPKYTGEPQNANTEAQIRQGRLQVETRT